MTDRELMQMALNELERLCRTFSYPPDILYDTINALRARLAQPEQEEDYDAIANKQLASLKAAAKVTFEDAVVRAVHKLYNAPPQQPEQEPCIHVNNPKGCYRVRCQLGNKCVNDDMSFRTAPPQREWQGLTKEECFELCVKHKDAPFSLLLAVQDKLKEKNDY